MTQKILVAHDPDTGDRSPADFAQEVARLTGAELIDADPQGVDAAIRDVQPALVVVGSGRRDHADRVIHGAPCPVAVVPAGYVRPAAGLRTVGAAFAPTSEGGEALRAAARLARTAGAGVRAVMALSPKHAAEQSPGLLAVQQHEREAAEDIASRHRLQAQDALDDAIAKQAGDVEVDKDVLFQDPAHALVAASANLDLLVMGSRGHGPVRSVLLGSVSRRVTADAACPVLVLPHGTEDAIERLLPAAGAGTAP